jgi:hypothetical protein
MSSEERDDLNPEADVEGHGKKVRANEEAPADDDVEGHGKTRANEEAPADDSDDDVEAHGKRVR